MSMPVVPTASSFQVCITDGRPASMGALPLAAFTPDLSATGGLAQASVQVGLESLQGQWRECWWSSLAAQPGTAPPLLARWGDLALGQLLVDEPDGQDIQAAARLAYQQLRQHLAGTDYPHLLRIWNYLDAVTEGDGDAERYRRFCVGRVEGMGDLLGEAWPAATCIGRHDGVRRLQVYWLSSRHPGKPLENPRQVSAWQYPRQYGPQSPTFARALLPDARDGLPLLISGTAAIVGHQSLHPSDVEAQLEETLTNLQALIDVARQHRPELPERLGANSPLKVYVRHQQDMARVAARLDALLPAEVPRLLLHGEICRAELLVEIEAMHG